MTEPATRPLVDAEALLPCPFCAGSVQFRKALWPSDGDYDGIIHVEITACPMSDFSNGTADGSVIASWNNRAALSAPRVEPVAEKIIEQADTLDGRISQTVVVDGIEFVRIVDDYDDFDGSPPSQPDTREAVRNDPSISPAVKTAMEHFWKTADRYAAQPDTGVREALIDRLARKFPSIFTPFGNGKDPNALAGNVVDELLETLAALLPNTEMRK
jgi:hypothetical protein